MICNIQDPITHQDYTRDPRNIARKAMSYMRNTGLADQCLMAPGVGSSSSSTTSSSSSGGTRLSITLIPSRALEPRPGGNTQPGLQARVGSGLVFPALPTDSSLVDIRSEMGPNAMAECGIATAAHFHEVATGGQCEIDLVPHSLVESADQVMMAKYIIRNVARRAGKTATFMPKPLFGDNGSGMHTHLTLWKDNQPLLAGQGYAGLSDLGIHAIGGLIKHAQALSAFANPTTNSYKRLVEGFEAPTKISYSRRNRSTPSSAIPAQQPQPQELAVIEYRGPRRGAANSYLLFSAMLAQRNPRRRSRTSTGPESRSIRTPTTSSPTSSKTCQPPPGPWKPRSKPCGPTTISCSAATCSPPT